MALRPPTALASRYAAAVALLGERRGMRPGLERTEALMAAAGRPDLGLRGVLVGGTNGKGSVCAVIESICRAAGLRTALLTNPHLRSYRERVVIDGEPITEEAFADLVEEVAAAATGPAEGATQFEILTVVGALAAARARSDVVVCEVGLGGRLDSTNVLDLGVIALTNVTLEHEQLLGATVAAIAAEKAAIVKGGNDVVTAASGDALIVIERRVADVGARLAVLGRDAPVSGRTLGVGGVEVAIQDGPVESRVVAPLNGGFQVANVAVALMACERLRRRGADIDAGAIARGCGSVSWPGRMEWRAGSPALLLDGAHNPAGMEALAAAAPDLCGERPVVGLFAAMADKRTGSMLEAFRRLTREVVFTEVGGERAMPASELAGAWGDGGLAIAEPSHALAVARERAGRSGVVVVCGSLYLVGAVLTALEPAPTA